MPRMNVNKTLVVGLGSTGTEICEMIARRIEWELGDVSRAPWVKMLCIETDANKQSFIRELNDFVTIEISAAEFREIVESPRLYDEKIGLSAWVDTETLNKLPGGEVSSGAGGIRMIGRLAFLYQQNHDKIHQELSRRLGELRNLSTAEATEKRGALPDGSNPDIDFGDETIRIIAIGTLCGGTCSGIASDFGYFLNKICSQSDKRVAIFTLPHPELTPAVEPKANCFKRNAYHALLELNHYHLSAKGRAQPIRFWDGTEQQIDRFPWDIPYLAMPKGAMPEHIEQLNRAIADRVFLNIFAPETCPEASLVDATIFDRDNRAHVFCSFGLSTLEFPVQQVTEACAKKLLSFALKEWTGRALPEVEHEARLSELGLDWASLTDVLLTCSDGDSIRTRIDGKREEVLLLARTNPDAAKKSLEELRAAFSVTGAQDAPGVGPLQGLVPRTIQGNRQRAAEAVIERLRSSIRTRLLKYEEGVSPLKQTLRLARERLMELRQARKPDYEDDRNRTDQLMARLARYHHSLLLNLVRLKELAIGQTLYQLRDSLETEMKQRIESESWKAMQTVKDPRGESSGVIDRIERLLAPVEKRVQNLATRLLTLANRLDARYSELAKKPPAINGQCIFIPEVTPGVGTVPEEYERCLLERDPSETLEHMRNRYASEIISAWRDLPDAIVPAAAPDSDWLLEEFQPNVDEAIPTRDLQEPEKVARQPFASLIRVDVLSRWGARESADMEAREVARACRPFLEINRALAEKGGRSPINTRCVILSPRSDSKERFERIAKSAMSNPPELLESPNAFRAILLEEWYRFPLSGAPAIMGDNGICKADCTDFPTFFSRKDIWWTGLSDSEVERTREAEELVVVMVLLNILEPKRGSLVLPWRRRYPGDRDFRLLPLEIGGAARLLAMEEKDKEGYDLRGALEHSRNKIRQLIRHSGSARKFIDQLDDAIKNGAASAIPDWDPRSWGRHIAAFCAKDQQLYAAYNELYPPDEALIESMRKDGGLYCPKCGGFIGKDEIEAAKNGWQCYIHPDHNFSAGLQ